MAHLKIAEWLKEHSAAYEWLSSPGTQSVDHKHSHSEDVLFVVFVHSGVMSKSQSVAAKQTLILC